MSKGTRVKRQISKTRQVRIREKELKSTLKFGVKLVLILAAVAGYAQLFFYERNIVAGGSNGPAARVAAKNNGARSNQSDSIKTGEQGDVLGPSLSDSEKGRQQAPETIALFTKSSDGPGSAMRAVPPSGDASLDPAGGKNELFPVSGPVDASKPMIAFTFDDDPCYSVGIRTLDTLWAYGGRATFFIAGSRVSGYKDTLKRVRDSGSGIGNHTFNRKNLGKASPEEMASQIEMINDAVEVVTGFWPKLVRVPYGVFESQVPDLVSYLMIQQNIDTQDWSSKDKGAIAASVLSRARGGSIVLMYDLYPATTETFETIILLLVAQGYQFVTVSEIYATRGVPLEAGQVYSSIPN